MNERPPVIESFEVSQAKAKVIHCAKKFVKEPSDIKRLADLEAALYDLNQAEIQDRKK